LNVRTATIIFIIIIIMGFCVFQNEEPTMASSTVHKSSTETMLLLLNHHNHNKRPLEEDEEEKEMQDNDANNTFATTKDDQQQHLQPPSLRRMRKRQHVDAEMCVPKFGSSISLPPPPPPQAQQIVIINDENTCPDSIDATAIASVMNSKKKKKKKQVRFDEETNNTYYPSNQCDEDLKQAKEDLWWSKEDRQRNMAECKDVIEKFRIHHPQYVLHFSKLYRTSMEAPSLASSDVLEKATVSLPLQIRGLEWGFAPRLKARRKQHVKEVLLACDIPDPSLRERFVSSRSIRSSRPSRIMARMIGEGDANSCSTSVLVRTTATTTTAGRKRTARKLPLTCTTRLWVR
jgi:hypothetical protein